MDLLDELRRDDYLLMEGGDGKAVILALGHRPRSEFADAAYLLLAGLTDAGSLEQRLAHLADMFGLPDLPTCGLLIGVKYAHAAFAGPDATISVDDLPGCEPVSVLDVSGLLNADV